MAATSAARRKPSVRERPIAAPSANRSGQVSPTSVRHVLDGLEGRIAAVLDSGPCRVGVESTVLDLSGPAPVLLRPGGVATIIGMVPFGTKIELHGADFLRDRKIQGTSMGGNRFRVDMPRLLELWRQGRLKLDTLVSGHVKLSEINEGFAMLKTGAPVRNLINFGVV